eukprot:TRINITY_DN2758_c0_g1_i2.p1 TRINITY_DN2758_c0_g1~~TRINITY_DN2758_c0_g1_i2.p1  ORF type:complete len:123 (-),score=45.06 TRINITY_DN2758_c0_g1_i2:59-427(-)
MGLLRSTYDCWTGATTTLVASDEKKLADYAVVLLAGPVWWYTLCTPLLSYVKEKAAELSGKRLVLLSTQGGSGHEKALAALRRELPKADVFADVSFLEKDINNGDFKAALHTFVCKQFNVTE